MRKIKYERVETNLEKNEHRMSNELNRPKNYLKVEQNQELQTKH